MEKDVITRGKLKLQVPFKSDTDEQIEELLYDFDRISGSMLLSVLGDGDANGKTGVTNRQALELFFKACSPEDNAKMTANEMRQKLSAKDMPVAMRLGAAFFMNTYVSGLANIGER